MQTENDIYPNETFYIDSRGFLYLKLYCSDNNSILTVEKLNKYIDSISSICDKNITSVVIDIRDVFGVVSNIHSSFRLISKDIQLKTFCKKIGFIANSAPIKSKINNYLLIHNPAIHIRVFNNIDECINYCISS
ncbi:MAG: hypothetical protein IIC74_05100 [Bacteroidetes bacterium]|nr:hypothetical protein [Bacteroidota bacterium]